MAPPPIAPHASPDDRPLILISGIDPVADTGGHGSYVKAHALAAAAAGFSPQVFCLSASSGVERTGFGVLHRIGTRARHYLVGPTYRRPLVKAVADYLEGCGHSRPHLIHGFGLWAGCAAGASSELARRGIASVPLASSYATVSHEWKSLLRAPMSRDGLWPQVKYLAWYPWVLLAASRAERWGYERVRVVLVNYDAVGRMVRAQCRRPPAIRRLPYASPASFGGADPFSPSPAPAALSELRPVGAPLVVSVSRHSPRKGVDVLLRALGTLRRDGVAFRGCLVGPGPLLDAHRSLASSLGLSGRVAVPGLVDDVAPYLANADVFVLPSLQEGSGSVALLEALQAGLAVVASACDGIPEDLLDDENALLVAPGDEAGLREAIAAALDDGELRARLGAAARQLYERRFTAEPFVAALEKTYDQLSRAA